MNAIIISLAMANTKILIVEDESIVAKDIQIRLKKFGYEVPAIASTGEEALKLVTELYPDLVLMDIRIKGEIDGVETARRINDIRSVPVVYLTAYADDSTLSRVKLTDPFGYILKPFKERELYTAVEIALTKYRMEKQLRDNEKWLSTVLKSIADGVIVTDNARNINFINPVAEALTGWKLEEVISRDITEVLQIVDEETHRPVESPIVEALQAGASVNLPEKVVLIDRNGNEIPIADTAAPIKDEQGNINGAVLVFRDITTIKQAEEAHRKQAVQEVLLAELERLNQLKDEFLNTVSHELRTPMTNMKMAIQMLKVSSNVEQLQFYLEILQTECNREIELINNILDLQRLEVAPFNFLSPEPINLPEWLPGLVQSFYTRTQQRQQTLKLQLPLEMPPLICDRPSLERLLVELLNNACKYTPARGEIVLDVNHNAGTTTFTISNQAEIPTAELPRIFDKFYRIPNADPWKQGGTGLGLTLVKKLVQQLQGTIEVESSGGWTAFTIRLNNLTRSDE